MPAVDIVVLAGNAVIPTIDAACRLAADAGVPLLISGGIASTVFSTTRYATIRAIGRCRSTGARRRISSPISPTVSGISPRQDRG